MALETDVRTDIETGLDQIQQITAPLIHENPDMVHELDDIIGKIRQDLMLLYAINK